MGLQVGAEKELRTVIEGESLFNDGSAYVLFLLFHVSTVQCIVLCVAWQYGMQDVLVCFSLLVSIKGHSKICRSAEHSTFHVLTLLLLVLLNC